MCRSIAVYSLLLLLSVISLAQNPPEPGVSPLQSLMLSTKTSLPSSQSPNAKSPDWITTYNAFLAPATDAAVDVAVDPGGNVFVTGYSDSLKNGFDIMTIKYASNGRLIWKKRYNSGVGIADYPVAIIPHTDGSVSICGYADIEPGLSELLTLRYDSTGRLLWLKRYSSGGSVRPLAAVADKQGGLTISVGLTFPDGGADAMLMNYSSRGELLWDYTYSPLGVQQSTLNALFADEAGNVYAGGFSSTTGLLQMLLVKLGADGQILWSREFDSAGRDELAVGICALPDNNICMAGNSLSVENDMRFISVSGAGGEIWQQHISFSPDDRLIGIAASQNGLVATAYSQDEGISEVNTFQLNVDGDLIWSARFPEDHSAFPTDITIDDSGNSLMVGFRERHSGASGIIAAKYNPSGDLLWSETLEHFGESHHDGRAVVAGENGEVFLSGYGFSAENGWDMLTYSLDAAGETVWMEALNAPETSREQGVVSILDAEENLITLANSFSGLSGWDVLLTKHTPGGDLLWNYRVDHCGTDDEAIDLHLGNDGILILSQAVSENGLLMGSVTKLSFSGDELFREELPKNAGWNLRPECLGAAADEALYIAATEYQGGNSTGVIISLNEGGSINWRYASSENQLDRISSIASLAANESFVAVGGIIPGSGNSQKVGITMLNAAGQFQWQKDFQGSTGYLDELNDLAFGEDNSVAFAATVYNNAYNRDILAGRYAADGSLLWLDELNGSGDNNDLAYGMRMTPAGETFLIGRTFRGSEGNDIILLKYDVAGNRVGEWFIAAAPLFNDELHSWTVNAGDILIAIDSPDNSIQLVEMDYFGQILDQSTVNLDAESQQSVHTLHRLASGDVLLGGSVAVGSWSALAIASMQGTPTGILNTPLPLEFSLKQNYPNPFNPSTQIEFSLTSASSVYLEVLNTLGEVVAVLTDKYLAPGVHKVLWKADSHASGVYFYRMRVDNQSVTKRMILLR